MFKRELAIAGIIALGGMSACGQKGPLFLPDKTGTVITREGTTDPEAPRTEDSSNKKEDQDDKDAPK